MGKTSRNVFLLLGVTAGAALAYFATSSKDRKTTAKDLGKNLSNAKDRFLKSVNKQLSKIGEGDSVFL